MIITRRFQLPYCHQYSSPIILLQFQKRFCSTGGTSNDKNNNSNNNNNNNNNNARLIQSLQQIIINSQQKQQKWIQLRSVAHSFDETLLEQVSEEYGGLKQFIEQCPEAKNEFKIRSNPETKAVEIMMSSVKTGEIEKQQNSDPWLAFSAPPLNPDLQTRHQQVHQQQQQNSNHHHHHHSKNHSRQQANNFAEDAAKITNEKALIKSIPSFCVPLMEVLKLELSTTNESLDCKGFLQKLKNQGASHLLSIVFPYDCTKFENVWDALLHETTTRDDILNYCFISILPPFVATHLNQSVDELLAESCRVADYDMCRLARYLSNDNFVTVTSLVNSNVPSLLQKPLMHVVAAFPNHFEYIPPNGKLPTDASFIAGVEDSCKGADEKGCPHVSSSLLRRIGEEENKGTEHQEKEVQTNEKEKVTVDLGYVRFILHSAELEKCLGGAKQKLRELNFVQLSELLKLIGSASGKQHQDAEFLLQKGLEFGLGKAIPTGIKRVQMKHMVIRLLIRLRFPRGNPFFDRDVFAHYLFDILPAGEPVTLESIRLGILPESGRTAAPMSSAYLASYPHLFRVYHDHKMNLMVQRADSEILPDVVRRESITEHQIVEVIWIVKPASFALGSKTASSMIMCKLPLSIVNILKESHGGFIAFIRKKPEYFEFTEGEFFIWKKCPPNLDLARLNGRQLFLVE